MTKLEVYVCDRCGTRIYLREGNEPNSLLHKPTGKLLHLCEDCNSSFDFWIEYTEEFDNLANKIALKITGEVE